MIMKGGLELISDERIRQIAEEGWNEKHDSYHKDGELAVVAAIYAVHGIKNIHVARMNVEIRDSHLPAILDAWPDSWDVEWDKREKHDHIRRLTIAGALIAAEIDRIQAQGG